LPTVSTGDKNVNRISMLNTHALKLGMCISNETLGRTPYINTLHATSSV